MTTIYVAGGELSTNDTAAMLSNGIKHKLMSFYYINMKCRDEYVVGLHNAYPGVSWFLDSGVFTFTHIV